jgi:hypothetical protein
LIIRRIARGHVSGQPVHVVKVVARRVDKRKSRGVSKPETLRLFRAPDSCQENSNDH